MQPLLPNAEQGFSKTQASHIHRDKQGELQARSSNSARSGRALHPHHCCRGCAQRAPVATGGELNVRLLLCSSPFADLYSDPHLLPLFPLILPHGSYQADHEAESHSAPLKRGVYSNCKTFNAKHTTWISGIHITKQSNKQPLMLRNVHLH